MLFRSASGQWVSDRLPLFSSVVDEVCFIKSMYTDQFNHGPAQLLVHTGNQNPGSPSAGAWTTYGLGTENQNLPGFIVLPEVSYPQGGAANWGNGFLPANFQGTPLRAKGSPILDLTPPKGISPEHQRENLDLLAKLNAAHRDAHPQHAELAEIGRAHV